MLKSFLLLQVPPKIIEEKSTLLPSHVKEGDSLSLYCHAEGMPTPKVSWYYREKAASNDMISNHHFKRHERSRHEKAEGRFLHEGSTLTLNNLTRHNSGIFECIANNSVPPAASRKIKVTIEYAPEVHLDTARKEQAVGQEARFDCRIKASPLTNHYWMKDGLVIDNAINGAYSYMVNSNTIENRRSLQSRSFEVDYGANQLSSKYEILIYDQNINENSLVSALTIKVNIFLNIFVKVDFENC